MKILFCGTVVPEKYDTKLKYLSPAGNRFQVNFCKELLRQGQAVKILSYIGFPLEGAVPEFAEDPEFFNGKISYVYKAKGFLRSLKSFVEKMTTELETADVLITYNVIYAWLLAPCLSKKSHTKSVLILADYSGKESYRNHLKKIYAGLQLACIRRYDFVVGLSVNTAQLLKEKQNFFCIEGGINRSVFDQFHELKTGQGEIVFMYAGLLEKVTGIDLLLEAFHQIDIPNIQLAVSGKGGLNSLVEEYAARDARIINLGYLEYDQYLENLKKADVLVNPRNMNLEENKNNFPSKIMEYLATGKPIISTKFAGYEKFSDVIDFCETDLTEIKEQLQKASVNCRGHRSIIHERNRKFAEQFLWDRQISEILSLLN